MASSLAKHRYLVLVATGAQLDSGAGVNAYVRRRALERCGEVGLGRLQPVVKVYDARTRVCVLRVRWAAANHVPQLLGGAARVVARCGSARTCRPRALALLRARDAAAGPAAAAARGGGAGRDAAGALEKAEAAIRAMGT